jgi:creatinine amidohydrolase
MDSQDRELYYLNGHRLFEKKFDKVILPVGAVERHGDHLPIGTDMMVAYELSKIIAQQVDKLLVMPPIAYGTSEHYASFAPTISISAETMISLLKDVLEGIIQHGFKKIIIFNGHDGNISPIEIAARHTKVLHPEVVIAAQNAWWATAGKLLPPDTFEVWNGLGHAGEGETSMVLALHPELVDMEYAIGRVPTDLSDDLDIKWLFKELTPTGASGDPTKGTREKGEKMKEVLVKTVVDFIKKMDAVDWKYDLFKG